MNEKVGQMCHRSCSLAYSTVGRRRTVCRRTATLELHLKMRATRGWKNELRRVKFHNTQIAFAVIVKQQHDDLRLHIEEALAIKTLRPDLNKRQEEMGTGFLP